MAAPLGNNFWEIRTKHGRDRLFAEPDILWEAACEYFQWCIENPLIEKKPFAYEGTVTLEDVPKMRPFTLNGLCLYLNISDSYFRVFKKDHPEEKDFLTVISKIEKTIYDQKFTGAACDFFNANIIARDLGLSDKKELAGPGGEPLLSDKGDDELKQQLTAVLSKLNADNTNPQP